MHETGGVYVLGWRTHQSKHLSPIRMCGVRPINTAILVYEESVS